jgi:hypothetical protein
MNPQCKRPTTHHCQNGYIVFDNLISSFLLIKGADLNFSCFFWNFILISIFVKGNSDN